MKQKRQWRKVGRSGEKDTFNSGVSLHSVILSSKRVISRSTKWTDRPLSLINRALSGNPKGHFPSF